MDFINIINTFTKSVEDNKGAKLASLFTEDGIYNDYIYGPFEGRKNIELMIKDHFYSDAKSFSWEMYDPVYQGNIGYARYRFSFTSTMDACKGSRVAVPGMAFFQFQNNLIKYYTETVNGGIPMAQLNLPAEKIKRVFQKWSDRTLNQDPNLKKMFLMEKNQ
jgi:ketosteroid isomerase-like protein